jgi:thymidylate kinase
MNFLIEGLDRLGKSTLIDGIRQKSGYHQVIHCGKPELLECYNERFFPSTDYNDGLTQKQRAQRLYQYETFLAMFHIVTSDAKVIYDRAHLGECVYSPIYRGFSGDYVFDLERLFGSHQFKDTRLILLIENFNLSKHFVEDGHSMDPTKRREEQELFIAAFEKSIMPNKRMICVTDIHTGNFRPKEEILKAALE